MSTQSMEWDLFYFLQMSKPQTMQELATQGARYGDDDS